MSVSKGGAAQIIPFGANVLVTWPTTEFDGMGEFDDTPANSWFQPLRAGYYQVNLHLLFVMVAGAGFSDQCTFYNPVILVAYAGHTVEQSIIDNYGITISQVIYMTPNDRLQILVNTTNVLGTILGGAPAWTRLTIHRLS